MIALFSIFILIIVIGQENLFYGISKKQMRRNTICFYQGGKIEKEFDFDDDHLESLRRQERVFSRYKGDKTVKEHDLELFWFLNARKDMPYTKILGFNREIFEKYYRDKGTFYDYKIVQDTPIVKDGKLVSETYSHLDYPNFRPTVYFEEGFSIGELERIKKSFILIKIVLHSDEFLKMFKKHQKIFSIQSYYSQDVEIEDEHTKKNHQKVPKEDIEEIYHLILTMHKKIFLKKSEDSTSSKKRLISADSVGNIIKEGDGIIRFHNRGKSLNYYSEYFPILLFHEYLHTLGYIHVTNNYYVGTKENPYDMVYQLAHIFLELYIKFKFPIIPYCYYKGYHNRWRLA